MRRAAILDVDGTLVDTNYHHTLAWYRAFRRHGIVLPELKRRGHPVVLASSSIREHLDRFLDLLDVRGLVDDWTMKDDVEGSKPDPDLVEAALAKAGTRAAVMLGDTPWDREAARRAGMSASR